MMLAEMILMAERVEDGQYLFRGRSLRRYSTGCCGGVRHHGGLSLANFTSSLGLRSSGRTCLM